VPTVTQLKHSLRSKQPKTICEVNRIPLTELELSRLHVHEGSSVRNYYNDELINSVLHRLQNGKDADGLATIPPSDSVRIYDSFLLAMAAAVPGSSPKRSAKETVRPHSVSRCTIDGPCDAI